MVRQKREKGSDLRDCERERYEWEYYIEKISRELEEEEEEIKRKRRFKDHFFKIYHFTLVCVICVRGFRLNTCVTTVVCLPLIKCKYLTREREWENESERLERKRGKKIHVSTICGCFSWYRGSRWSNIFVFHWIPCSVSMLVHSRVIKNSGESNIFH